MRRTVFSTLPLQYVCAISAFTLAALAIPARAETVVVRSGNGIVGGTDTLVNMLLGPANSAFGAAFTPADFTSAQTGPDAFIIAPNGAWIASLPSNPAALWISTNAGGAGEGGTALYAISFTLANAIATASIDLRFAVDNTLGGGPNQGVFLNGSALSGTTTGGGFGGENTITRNDIASLLVVGTNTLYINATDQGGPGGLIFSATINTTSPTASAAPEPGALALVAIAGFPLTGMALRRRRRSA
jgi:hypothetical protein